MNYFQYDQLYTILDDTDKECQSRKDDMIRQIALCHVLARYPNKDERTLHPVNLKINANIINYNELVEKYIKKWKL